MDPSVDKGTDIKYKKRLGKIMHICIKQNLRNSSIQFRFNSSKS